MLCDLFYVQPRLIYIVNKIFILCTRFPRCIANSPIIVSGRLATFRSCGIAELTSVRVQSVIMTFKLAIPFSKVPDILPLVFRIDLLRSVKHRRLSGLQNIVDRVLMVRKSGQGWLIG